MDEDPSNKAFILSLLEGYGANEAEVMDIETTPTRQTGEAGTLP
jgi:hypothetical protein